MNHRAADVPRLRAEIVKMWASPIGRQIAAYDLARSRSLNATQPSTAEHTDAEIYLHENATLYWASADMCTLLRTAARSMPPTVMDEGDLPDRFGFLVFEEAIPGIDTDIPDHVVHSHAMAWGLVDHPSGAQVVHLEFYEHASSMLSEELLAESRKMGVGELYYMGASTWPLRHQADDMSIYPDFTPEQQASLIEDRKLLHSFFLLLAQKATEVRDRFPQRQERRRAQRNGYEIAPVRIVSVRAPRPSEKAVEHRDVEWTHRWIVRPHWRNQWYPSQNRHYPKFIMSFVKGPEGLPLVAKETVHALK